MSIIRNDEQIKVGETTGLVSGSSFFLFDGTLGRPDYRGFNIVITEISGRGILITGVDFSYSSITGRFDLLQNGDVFPEDTYYNVHFEPDNSISVVPPSSIIDISFFILDINIPNTDEEPIIERINGFMSKYERICLEGLLGYNLYKVFLTEFSERMTNILYGVEYEDSYGKTKKWKGLVHDTNISLIAYYVYYFIQETSATQTTGMTTYIPKLKEGISVSPQDKMVSAWNKYSKEASELLSFLKNNISVYPEFNDNIFCLALKNSQRINIFGI